MKIAELILTIIGAITVFVLLIRVIWFFVKKKFLLSGPQLVRYLRAQGDHFIALMKCPLCGYDTAQVIETEDHKFYVKCSMCGCSTDQFDSPEEALLSWDTRNGQLMETWEFNGGEVNG